MDKEQNPYPESLFPTLSDAKLKVASFALEAAGISSPQYTANIARFVWDQAIKAHFASAGSVAGWVSVEERLPEESPVDFKVLAYWRRNYDPLISDVTIPASQDRGSTHDEDFKSAISHWQPLPAAPGSPTKNG